MPFQIGVSPDPELGDSQKLGGPGEPPATHPFIT